MVNDSIKDPLPDGSSVHSRVQSFPSSVSNSQLTKVPTHPMPDVEAATKAQHVLAPTNGPANRRD